MQIERIAQPHGSQVSRKNGQSDQRNQRIEHLLCLSDNALRFGRFLRTEITHDFALSLEFCKLCHSFFQCHFVLASNTTLKFALDMHQFPHLDDFIGLLFQLKIVFPAERQSVCAVLRVEIHRIQTLQHGFQAVILVHNVNRFIDGRLDGRAQAALGLKGVMIQRANASTVQTKYYLGHGAVETCNQCIYFFGIGSDLVNVSVQERRPPGLLCCADALCELACDVGTCTGLDFQCSGWHNAVAQRLQCVVLRGLVESACLSDKATFQRAARIGFGNDLHKKLTLGTRAWRIWLADFLHDQRYSVQRWWRRWRRRHWRCRSVMHYRIRDVRRRRKQRRMLGSILHQHVIVLAEILVRASERVSILHDNHRLKDATVRELLIGQVWDENIRLFHLVGLDAADVAWLRSVEVGNELLQLERKAAPHSHLGGRLRRSALAAGFRRAAVAFRHFCKQPLQQRQSGHAKHLDQICRQGIFVFHEKQRCVVKYLASIVHHAEVRGELGLLEARVFSMLLGVFVQKTLPAAPGH